MEQQVVDARMRAYYDARAGEYDDWWLGEGQFARRDRPGWATEVHSLTGLLEALPPARTLDVACGSGFLTQHLRGEITAIDQSAEMVRVASQRLPEATVFRAEAVPLPFEDGEFDRLITGHFYGHLLEDEREAFLAEARRVAAQLVVVDSALHDGVEAEERQERVLDDGSRHSVYKRYFHGRGLAAELGGARVLHENHWFVVVAAG